MTLADMPLQLGVKRQALSTYDYKPQLRHFLTDAELLQLPAGDEVICDIELFPNYFLAGFKHCKTGKYFYAEQGPHNYYSTNLDRLTWILYRFKHITFNGRRYDLPLIDMATRGADIAQLKAKSDEIILRGGYASANQRINFIDIMNVAPLNGSLKMYGARVGSRRIQELPLNPHEPLTEKQIYECRDYNCNDLDTTEDVYKELSPAIKLRESLSQKYQFDLRSHSDAQIAEVIMETALRQRTGKFFKAPRYDENFTFRYERPDMLAFKNSTLVGLLKRIEDDTFGVDAFGYGVIPKWLRKHEIELYGKTYRLGGGGLHSTETQVSFYSNDNYSLFDYDVSSYYPYIIINCGWFPPHIGPVFIPAFKEDIVDRRIAAKIAKLLEEAAGLKIGANGVFGKTSNKYSIVYAPQLGTHITVTGQLLLLMQIEWVASHGIYPISANTDGVIYNCPRGREAELGQILEAWSKHTGFIVEKTKYRSYHARDVNNFIGVKDLSYETPKDTKDRLASRFLDMQLGVKTKGAYCERGSAQDSILSRNPEHFVCQDAVMQHLTKGIDIRQTIEECNDVRRFACVEGVGGGAHKNGVYLGKVVRWYYAKGEYGNIQTLRSNSQVPTTAGARPLMEFDGMPADLSKQWYISKAQEILHDIGVSGIKPTQPRFF